MTRAQEQRFSLRWTMTSAVIFIAAELFLGGWIGRMVAGRFVSLQLRFMLQGLLNLASFFVGGFVVGLVSPGVRTLEPAVGAFLSVALVMGLALFTPYSFIRFSLTKVLIGGAIAFLLALIGARLGERAAGNLR